MAAASLQPHDAAAVGGGERERVTSVPHVWRRRVETQVESPRILTRREEEVDT
jgi:hypothetical protein